MRSGASAEQLVNLAKALRDEQKWYFIQETTDDLPEEPPIVCSLGLVWWRAG